MNCTRKQGYSDPCRSHSLLHLTESVLWSSSAPSAGKWSCLLILCGEYMSRLVSETKFIWENWLILRLIPTPSTERDSVAMTNLFLSFVLPWLFFTLCYFFNHNFHFISCIIVIILIHSVFMLEFSVSMGADLFICSFLCSPFNTKIIFKKMWRRESYLLMLCS